MIRESFKHTEFAIEGLLRHFVKPSSSGIENTLGLPPGSMISIKSAITSKIVG